MVFEGICELDVHPRSYCVYAHLVEGAPVYIGSGRYCRAFEDIGRGYKWGQLTKNGYKVVILRQFYDRSEAYEYEEELIKQYNPEANLLHRAGYHPRPTRGRSGMPHSEESIRKMSEMAKLSWQKNRANGIISRKKFKPIQCLETGQIYDGIGDASRKTGVSPAGISICMNGKVPSIKGLTFVKLEE